MTFKFTNEITKKRGRVSVTVRRDAHTLATFTVDEMVKRLTYVQIEFEDEMEAILKDTRERGSFKNIDAATRLDNLGKHCGALELARHILKESVS